MITASIMWEHYYTQANIRRKSMDLQLTKKIILAIMQVAVIVVEGIDILEESKTPALLEDSNGKRKTQF